MTFEVGVGMVLLACVVLVGVAVLARRALDDRDERQQLARALRDVHRLAADQPQHGRLGIATQRGRYSGAACSCGWRGRVYLDLPLVDGIDIAVLELHAHRHVRHPAGARR